MSKSSRVVVLVVGLMTALAAIAGSASASTWTNGGDTAFTATAGPATLSVSGVATITCTGATSTSADWPRTEAGPNYIATGLINYPTCRLSALATSVSCTYTLTNVPPVTGTPGRSSGTFAVTCVERALGCRITGTILDTYTNASMTANGFLALNGASGLRFAGCPFTGNAVLAPNPAVFTATAGTGGNHPTFRFGPILNNP